MRPKGVRKENKRNNIINWNHYHSPQLECWLGASESLSLGGDAPIVMERAYDSFLQATYSSIETELMATTTSTTPGQLIWSSTPFISH